jgi:hypothetical protein
MSKERELLKNILMLYRKDESCMSWGVANEIEELLSQPEQEPTAYAYDYLDSLYYATDKDVADYPRISRDGRALYTAPANKNIESLKDFLTKRCIREPFSEHEITKECDGKGQAYISSFIDGVEFAEKAHGIGVENDEN